MLFKAGDIVKSISGHDKNRLFVVITIDKNGKVVIIDGRYRALDKPKLKNAKHLVKVAHDDAILNKLQQKSSTNTEIFKLIKNYKE